MIDIDELERIHAGWISKPKEEVSAGQRQDSESILSLIEELKVSSIELESTNEKLDRLLQEGTALTEGKNRLIDENEGLKTKLHYFTKVLEQVHKFECCSSCEVKNLDIKHEVNRLCDEYANLTKGKESV